MEKLENYVYEELDFDAISKQFASLIEKFKSAKTAAKQIAVMEEINELNIRIETAFTLCSIRFSQNVNDEYYSKQNEILDENGPKLQVVMNKLNEAVVNSPFKKQLTKAFGSRLVPSCETALKTFSPEIVNEMIETNKLSSEYSKLIGSAKIKFKGEVLSLSQLGKYMSDNDRKIRMQSSKIYYKFFADNESKLDEIYDKMVHYRDTMAKKLGFNNYLELGYLIMDRSEYTSSDVEQYRDDIYKYVVPVTKKLFKRQQKRLNIRGMKYFDYNLEFLSGNAKPIGTSEELIEKAGEMYNKMSPETAEFFSFMRESNLLDLVARTGKQGGGYTTFIPAYKAPFIFSNFNGTQGDIDVLTHEAGHAFMCYRCREPKLVEFCFPTLEACEIHSMSMELFAYPYMDSFFGKDAEKYKFSHLASCVTFLPYGAAVDEFQSYVYLNPSISPKERRAKWREIEMKYLPHLKYGNNEFLNNGGRWMKQAHIFNSPLYYIDYTLAQICAFQFFTASQNNYEEAWGRYLNLCNLGGNDTFLKLLKNKGVKLTSPFAKGCIKKTIKPIKEYLDKFDDEKM